MELVERGALQGVSFLPASTGLTQVGARYLDVTLGRFISVDPVMDLLDPQQWNAYAYANNNPTTWSDPTGRIVRRDGDSPTTKAWPAINPLRLYANYEKGVFLAGRDAITELSNNPLANPLGFAKSTANSIQTAGKIGGYLLNAPGSFSNKAGALWSSAWHQGFDAAAQPFRNHDPYAMADQAGHVGLNIALVAATWGAGAETSAARVGSGLAKEATSAAEAGAPFIKAGSAGGTTAGKVFPQSIRQQALAENPSTCVYCRMETQTPQVDHVIPRSIGGNALLENAQTTCPFCNASKGAREFPVNPPFGYRGAWPPEWWGTSGD